MMEAPARRIDRRAFLGLATTVAVGALVWRLGSGGEADAIAATIRERDELRRYAEP